MSIEGGSRYTVERTFTSRAEVRERLIRLGVKRKGAPQLQMRLVQVKFGSVPENQDLKVVKIRKKEAPLDLSPFPRPHLTFFPSS